METVLVTRADDDHASKSVFIYRHNGGSWAFVNHGDDPGLDYVVRPNGTTLEVYTHNGDCPEGVPTLLWEAWMHEALEG